MGLIREPLDVDFTVDPRMLTAEDKTAISEYIRSYKANETNKQHIAPAKDKNSTKRITAAQL